MSDEEYLLSVSARTQNPAMFPELRHGMYDELLQGWWKHFRREQVNVLGMIHVLPSAAGLWLDSGLVSV